MSIRDRGSGNRSRKDQEEAWLSTEKLHMGYSDVPCVRVGRARLPPLRRADENTRCHRFPGCDPQDFNLPWPPHEGPAHCPCGIGPGHGVCMVAERPIRSAIRWTCAQMTKPGQLIRPAIRYRREKNRIPEPSSEVKSCLGSAQALQFTYCREIFPKSRDRKKTYP